MTCMKGSFVEGLILDSRFESVSPLNNGSFGMVFLAKDLKSGEHVAIKCIGKTSTNDSYFTASDPDHRLELFCHDRLGYHPNVVNLIHAFETDAHMYLVLEFCSMGDLFEAIRLGRGPLETEHVRAFMLQLVDAVEFMHSKGLYHRDIKPENIFLTQDGSMKLGDFGLSTTEKWTYDSSVGSDRYMAPEQYDAAESGYDPAQADIWAIGICLLNILFSRNPFVTPSEADVVFADYVNNKESLFDYFSEMSPDTFNVLEHALSIDPTKRSLTALRDALVDVHSFKECEISDDDFCTEDREVVPATANRQPLRTPSIVSPPMDKDNAFPWPTVLHMSPTQAARQLSVVPDTELSHDDLFDDSTYAVPAETPSIDSVIDSALNDPPKSMTLREPKPRNPPEAEVIPMSSSLPIAFSKTVPATASMFDIKEEFLSWSEIYEEEATWSSNSVDQTVTIHQPITFGATGTSIDTNPPTPSLTNTDFSEGRDSEDNRSLDSVAATAYKLPSYSPPAKRSTFDAGDKWAALGHRRRSVNPSSDSEVEETKETKEVKREGSRESAINGLMSWRQGLGNGLGRGLGWASGYGKNRGGRRNQDNRGDHESRGDGWRNRFGAFGWEAKKKDVGRVAVQANDEHVTVMNWQRDAHMYPHLQANSNKSTKKGFEIDVLSDVEEKSQEEDGDGGIEQVGGWPRLQM